MIDKLEFFIALAREKHFGRAAESCGVTQPTLSAGLKQLEETLGVMLVQRGARFQGLTVEGERVLDWARRIVGDSRAMREEVRALKKGVSGHVTIGVVPTALAAVTDLIAPFRATHPDVTITIRSRTSQGILSDIESLEADCGISYLDNEPVGRMKTQALYEERYGLVTAKSGPLGERETVSWREAAGLPLALLTPDMQNRRIIDRALASVGIRAEPRLQSDSMVALLASVAAGPWCSIMPMRMARFAGESLSVYRLTEPELMQTIGLIAPQREPMMPIVAGLMVEARRVWLASMPMGPGTRDELSW
jgi:DNA-binding transcriptional LysR family regulator